MHRVGLSIQFWLLAIFVVLPVVILIHEAGHAIAIKAFAGKRPVIILGKPGRLIVRLSFSTFDFHLYTRVGFGRCVWDPHGSSVREIRRAGYGGPIGSGLGGGVFALALVLFHPESADIRHLLLAGLFLSAWGCVSVFSDSSGDGKILRTLRNYPDHLVLRGQEKAPSLEEAASVPPPSAKPTRLHARRRSSL